MDISNNNFAKELIDILFISLEKGTIQAVTWVWNGLTLYLLEHWIVVSIIF